MNTVVGNHWKYHLNKTVCHLISYQPYRQWCRGEVVKRHTKNTIDAKGNGLPPYKVHFPRKNSEPCLWFLLRSKSSMQRSFTDVIYGFPINHDKIRPHDSLHSRTYGYDFSIQFWNRVKSNYADSRFMIAQEKPS